MTDQPPVCDERYLKALEQAINNTEKAVRDYELRQAEQLSERFITIMGVDGLPKSIKCELTNGSTIEFAKSRKGDEPLKGSGFGFHTRLDN